MAKPILNLILLAQTAFLAGAFCFVAQPASAQYTTLRNPLLPNADYTPPQSAPPQFPPPPPGDGDTPAPVTPGMGGNPGYEPWVTSIPTTIFDQGNTQINLGVQPSDTSAPGQLGPQLGGAIPPPTSVPGNDPGILAPNNSGYQPPAIEVGVQAQGGLGADQAPTQKWGGQTTQDFGRNIKSNQYSGVSDFGVLMQNNPNLATSPQFSQDGPIPTSTASGPNTPIRQPSLPGAQETTDYGVRQLFPNGQTYQALQTQAPY